MRSQGLGILILLLATVTACSSETSTDRLVEALKTVRSWEATAQMVGEAWLHKDVPTAYAKQTLESAGENLQKEKETIAEAAPTLQQKTIVAQLQQLRQTISRMAAAVEQQDESTVAEQLQALSLQKKSLQSLIDNIGSQR